MASKYGVGAEVEWDWGGGKGSAKVEEVFTAKVTRTIKGRRSPAPPPRTSRPTCCARKTATAC